jgi:hypothetical protein
VDSNDKLDRPLFFVVHNSIFDTVRNSHTFIWEAFSVFPDILYTKTKIYRHLHYEVNIYVSKLRYLFREMII